MRRIVKKKKAPKVKRGETVVPELFKELVLWTLDKRKITMAQLSKRSGVSISLLYRCTKNDPCPPRLETAAKIAEGFGLSTGKFLSMGGL